jgi:hypothetical protein
MVCWSGCDVRVGTTYYGLGIQEKTPALAAMLVQGIHRAIANALASLLKHARNIARSTRSTIRELYRHTVLKEMDTNAVTHDVGCGCCPAITTLFLVNHKRTASQPVGAGVKRFWNLMCIKISILGSDVHLLYIKRCKG